jgi:type IV secretion system protein VirB10
MFLRPVIAAAFWAGLLAAQDVPPVPASDGLPKMEQAKAGDYVVEAGTKVPLSLINTISTKHSVAGDRVYLETSFPILAGGRIVIPVGSYVAGTVTLIKKPGRVKGRGELYVRFDSLTLPNGVTRDFRARIGGVDGQAEGVLDKAEGKVTSVHWSDCRKCCRSCRHGRGDRRRGGRGCGIDRRPGHPRPGCRPVQGHHGGNGARPEHRLQRE